MIKRFGLPNPSLPSQRSVDLVGRSTFDGIHDLSERINLHSLTVDQRSEDHVNMIRHHDRDSQVEFLSIVVPTAFEHDGTHALRNSPAVIGAECHKVLLVVTLSGGELSPIKACVMGIYLGPAD